MYFKLWTSTFLYYKQVQNDNKHIKVKRETNMHPTGDSEDPD